MDKRYDSIKKHQDSIKAMQIYDPLKELRDSIKAMQIHDPLKDLRDSMKATQMYDPLKNLRDSMKAMQIHDPLKNLRDSMKATQMYDPLKNLRDSMKAMQIHDPLKDLWQSMKAYQSIGTFESLVKEISSDRWISMLDDIPDIEINADGLISIDSELVTQEQVQEIAQKVISSALDQGTYSFEQYIDRLINEIRSLKEPYIQKLLALLIYPLIVGLVLSVANPVADIYVKEAIKNNDKKRIVKEVSTTTVSTFNEKSYLRSFRVVTATSLNVRKTDSNKSGVVGRLYLGDVVEVIKKDRKWSLISWQDIDSDALVRGWVFSRYLKVIK